MNKPLCLNSVCVYIYYIYIYIILSLNRRVQNSKSTKKPQCHAYRIIQVIWGMFQNATRLQRKRLELRNLHSANIPGSGEFSEQNPTQMEGGTSRCLKGNYW